MKYLLDTDIIVNHLRGREAIPEDIIRDGASISIITLGELLYGAHKSIDPKTSVVKLNTSLDTLGLNVENLNEDTMDEFGKIKAGLEKKGYRLEDFDLLIAATALIGKFILVTKNLKHFKRLKGLKLRA